MKFVYVLLVLLFATSIQAEDIYRVEIGKGYQNYSNEELRQRLWTLERAVWQLQNKVFELESKNNKPVEMPKETIRWTCTLKSFSKTFTSTKKSRGEAKAAVIKACSDETSSVHCDDDKVNCEQ